MIKRVMRLIKKEFLQLRRDRTMLPMIFLLPVVQLIMFGYAASTDVTNIKLAVLDQDKSQFSRQIVRQFTNAGYFRLSAYVNSETAMAETLDNGSAAVALVFPPGTSDRIAAGRTAVIQLIVDGSNSNSAGIALGYANQILARESNRLLLAKVRSLRGVGAPEVEARLRMWYNPDTKSVNFMVPSLIAMILMIGAMSNTSQAVVRERDRGTLEQLIVTPINRSELILGKIIPYAIIGLVQTTAIFLVALAWFRIPFYGSVWLLYGSALLFLGAALGQGLFVSTISKTRQQALMATMMFTMPAFMLSGFIFPVENMPASMYYLSFLVPMRYFLEIVRDVFLKGVGLEILWPQFTLLAIYAVAVFFLSAGRFQKKIS